MTDLFDYDDMDEEVENIKGELGSGKHNNWHQPHRGVSINIQVDLTLSLLTKQYFAASSGKDTSILCCDI